VEEKDTTEGNRTIRQKIKDAWNEDPASVILAAGVFVFATAKLIDSASLARSRRISDKQSRHYFKMSKKQALHVPLPPI
jgi:hypothetical protein